jgi:isopentenyl-diphosphate delta-isomerase
MMAPGSGLSWSPWFRIIAQHLLAKWWADLDRTLHTDDCVDLPTIHHLTA